MSDQNHSVHVMPLWIYLAVGGALLFLTVVTVAVSYVDFNAILGIEHVNIIIAMVIAVIKATLVALFFMHLLYDSKLNLAVFLISLVALGIFIGITMFDTMRRGDIYENEGGVIQQKALMYENMPEKTDSEHH